MILFERVTDSLPDINLFLSYLINHLLDSIRIGTIGTIHSWFPFHDLRPLDHCPRVGLEVKI